jgi:pimeloyl-ACP methyl ester carboxylesterase
VKDSTNRLGDWLKVLMEAPDDSLSAKSENYKQIKVPTLLIWGEKDTVTPLWQGQKLNALIPGSQLLTLSDIGHIPQIEDPKRFNETLSLFLEKLK